MTSVSKPNILVILTSHAADNQGRNTGWFLAEFAHAYNIFIPHFNVIAASPKGGVAPIATGSIALCPDEESQAFLREKEAVWSNTIMVEELVGKTDQFVACYLPGGYGPMFDLYDDVATQKVLTEIAGANKVIGAVCHGPAALINTKLPDGSLLLEGCTVNGFPHRDEAVFGTPEMLPFRLETELRRVMGPKGKFEMSSEPLGECVTIDRGGKLVMGQNPASVAEVAKAVMAAASNN